LCLTLKGFLPTWRELFGLGSQADSPTGEKYSQRTWTVPWPDFKKMRFVLRRLAVPGELLFLPRFLRILRPTTIL
jgi:hypothetical protein